MKDIKLVELFSGIGGFTKGLQEAGFNITKHYYSEIDKHAIANYKYNYPNAKHIGSVTDVRGKDLERPDIITFGSPCQDFSLAGKQTGLKGERSVLILEAIRLLRECQPSIFIWENVKGTFSSNDGADFWAILNAFTNIGRYRLEWQLLNTDWVLPQNRERIYLVGHLAGRSTGQIFPFTENDRLSDKPKRPEEGRTQTKSSTTLKASGAMKADDTFIEIPKKAGCLTGGGHSGGLHSDMTVIPVLTPDRKEKRQNGRRFKEAGEPAFTLNCQDQHGIMFTKNYLQ
jgi:DNA (cytosine-5)-methyltransferase 1